MTEAFIEAIHKPMNIVVIGNLEFIRIVNAAHKLKTVIEQEEYTHWLCVDIGKL